MTHEKPSERVGPHRPEAPRAAKRRVEGAEGESRWGHQHEKGLDRMVGAFLMFRHLGLTASPSPLPRSRASHVSVRCIPKRFA